MYNNNATENIESDLKLIHSGLLSGKWYLIQILLSLRKKFLLLIALRTVIKPIVFDGITIKPVDEHIEFFHQYAY